MVDVIPILLLTCIYVGFGLIFAAVFVTVGLGRVDAAAHGAPLGFRFLILPGIVALWPIMLVKWAAVHRKEASR